VDREELEEEVVRRKKELHSLLEVLQVNLRMAIGCLGVDIEDPNHHVGIPARRGALIGDMERATEEINELNTRVEWLKSKG